MTQRTISRVVSQRGPALEKGSHLHAKQTSISTWYISHVVVLLLILAVSSDAEQRYSHEYGMADGLPTNSVTCVKRDSHNLLWFCTTEGLSRFDGYTFNNYGVELGLPDKYVTDFLETRNGEYLVATAQGLAVFNPKPSPRAQLFTHVAFEDGQPRPITQLLEDRTGRIWIASGESLFWLVRKAGQWALRAADSKLPPGKLIENVIEDHEGNLWIVRFSPPDILKRTPDGHIELFEDPFFKPNRITNIFEDSHKNLWLSSYFGLALLVANPQPGRRIVERVFRSWAGQRPEVDRVYESSDGRLWVESYGLYELLGNPRTESVRFKFWSNNFAAELEDSAGNFWRAGRKTPRNGFTNYGKEDGLATQDIRSIFQGHDGHLYVVTGIHCRYIHRFDGKRFVAVAPHVPGHSASWDWQGWGWGQIHFQDHNGEWWVATGHGLLRYPKVKQLEDLAHTPPKATYRNPANIFRLYEDSRGDIWIAAWDGSARWERSTQRFQALPGLDGEPTAFAEDRAGNVWIGIWGGGLQRYRRGQFERLLQTGAPPGMISSLFLDHAGRMWAGSSRSGLIRFNDPAAEHPAFQTYSTKQGLSSNNVRAITEDHSGRIYLWTERGVDRFDPETGKVRQYTESEGLVKPYADNNIAFCDRNGTLWFGLDGLSRLDPGPDVPLQPPPIRITRLRIRGVDYPISELGETSLSSLVLPPNENQLQVEFASLNFAFGDVIKYQYKLDGADQVWSAPTDLRLVNYPRLGSGKYRFLVRAVNSEGLVSPVSAQIAFRLMPPVWMRWWFLSATGLAIAAAFYWLYRLRLRQLLELERVRTRIASDLHDDIGSSLTQIAIMSEVARRQGVNHESEPLGRIADLSRELVDSMSDIVWAINPNRDQLSDLIQRMRRFASDVLEAADIEVEFQTSSSDNDFPMHADVRRELFLIFKEAINNAARHSRCRRVGISVDLKGSQFLMKIWDDGQGFLPTTGNGQGHGLQSMRERARRLGGEISFASGTMNGTTLSLVVQLDHSVRFPRRPSTRV